MTTTLNASTSSGFVMTPDNSGNILLQYNGVAAPAFSAYNSGAGATIGTSATKVTYDTEEFDTANCFSSSRFTPTVAGYYQINAQLQPNASYTGGWISLYKNGSAYRYGTYVNTGSIPFGGFTVSSLVYLNGSTDYVEVYGVFTSAQQSAGTQVFSWFNGCLLRGA